MRTYDDEAIVIGASRLGEADKIVTLLTPGVGRVKAVAKGARKTGSRFGGRLETLNHLEVTLHRGRSLYILTGAHALEVFAGLRADLASTELALACGEATARAVHEGQAAPEHFAHLLKALRYLDTAGPNPLFFASFVLVLARISGFEFQFGRCLRCGLGDGLEHLSLPEGGAVCGRCKSELPCYRAGADVLALLEMASRAPDYGEKLEGSPQTVRMATHASVKLFEYHLEDRLRSYAVVHGLGLS